MKFIIFLTFILSLNSFAKSDRKRNSKLLKMISKEIKTIKKVRNRGPNLEYRLLELYTENLKIMKAVETEKFLKNRNPKLQKKYFFKRSISLNKKVESLGLKITKRWKNYRANAAIYYTLALNERDFNASKKTEKYLLKSLRVAQSGSPIVHHIKTTLAEMYYNDKKYRKAVRLYKDVITNLGDEWYAKHHYNYSWCLLKTKRISSALSEMLKAYKFSKRPRYVSVESQVLDAISIFYIQNDKIEEGTRFYIENVAEPAEYITKFATRAQTTKKFKTVESILIEGVQNAISKKQNQELVLYYNYQLEFFRTYKRTDKHLMTTKLLTKLFLKGSLKGENLEETIQKVKSYVGFLQIKLSKNKKVSVEEYDIALLKNTLDYFTQLQKIDVSKRTEYIYFQGETLFSVGEFKKAYKRYAKTLEILKKTKKIELQKAKKLKTTPVLSWNDKFAKKVINSLLASLSKLEDYNLSDVRYQTYVYSNHVKIWPKDDKSRLIYPKLFSIYFKKKDITKTIQVIKDYNKNFPSDLKAQKGMFAKVFDSYVEKKNISKITYWINEFNNGFLNYEKQYIKKATIILGTLLFNKIDKLQNSGKSNLALKEYNKIIENESYPNKIITQATFRSALVHLKALRTKKSYSLFAKSFKIDKTNELFKETKVLNSAVDELALAQNFNKALSLSYKTLIKFCKQDFKEKNELFKKSIKYSFIENNYRAIKKLNKFSSKCKIKKSIANSIAKSQAQLITLKGSIKGLRKIQQHYPKQVSKKMMATVAENKYWFFIGENNLKMAKNMKEIMINNGSKSIETINKYEKIVKDLRLISFKFTTNKFDGQIFNNEIESSLTKVKEIAKKIQTIQSMGHPVITPKLSIINSKQYEKLITSISKFTPFGFNKKETKMFKSQLTPLLTSLEVEKRNLLISAQNTTKKNTILSYENHGLNVTNQTKANVLRRYPASMLTLSLDLQGEQ
jgi:hypothetical protein